MINKACSLTKVQADVCGFFVLVFVCLVFGFFFVGVWLVLFVCFSSFFFNLEQQQKKVKEKLENS